MVCGEINLHLRTFRTPYGFVTLTVTETDDKYTEPNVNLCCYLSLCSVNNATQSFRTHFLSVSVSVSATVSVMTPLHCVKSIFISFQDVSWKDKIVCSVASPAWLLVLSMFITQDEMFRLGPKLDISQENVEASFAKFCNNEKAAIYDIH